MEALGSLMEARLAESWGAPGQPGSVAGIERVCGEILSRCRELAGAEREILTTPMHPQLADAQAKYQGLAAENIFHVLEVIKSIRSFIVAGGTGELNLNLQLTTDRLSGIVIPDLRQSRPLGGVRQPGLKKRKPVNDTSGAICLLLGLLALWYAWPMGVLLLLLALLFFAYAVEN